MMGLHEPMEQKAARLSTLRWPRLPELTPEKARMEALLFQGSCSIRHKIAGQIVTLSGPVRTNEPTPLAVDFQFGTKALRALLPQDALGCLLKLHSIEDEWQSYSAETAALVFEHLLAEAMAPLEPLLGGAFKVLKVGPSGKAATGTSLPLDAVFEAEDRRHIKLVADANLLAELAMMMTDNLDRPQGLDLSDLRFPAQLLGPSFTLPAKDLTTAKLGDGFFLECDWAALSRAEFVISGRLATVAQQERAGFQLTGELSRRTTINTHEDMPMSDTMTDDSDAATLPVTVRIELAETTITLAELQAMTAGSVLPFANELPSTVRLLANGKPIAKGDLVRIDGKVAVRLTEIC
jgi:type III secretion protein Q